jgi:hypothetical protein
MATVELAEISRSLRSVMGETAGQFRQAAREGNASLEKVVKDIAKTFAAQRKDLTELVNSIEEGTHESQQTASKIDTLTSLFQESVSLLTSMREDMKLMSNRIKILNDSTVSLNNNINQSLVGGTNSVLSGITNMSSSVTKAIGTIAVAGAAGTGAYLLNSSGSTPKTNYSASESAAKTSAEKYAGRSLSDNEWSELVRATNAEAGKGNQTEAAMVMASIINRSRDSGKSIEQTLRQPNQFQAVTGTSANPGPSANFTRAPDEKRAEQIYGAAANILEKVSKQQKDFTAYSPAAYGAGTNIGYRNKMLAAGGSVVGASVFNTSAPTISDSVTPQSSPVASADAPRVDSMSGFHTAGGGHGGHGEEGKLSGVQPGILEKFNQIQSQSGTSLNVTSGFRDPAHNAAVGGAQNSAHTRGNAVDVTFSGGVPETLKLIDTASKAGIGGIGVYRPGVLHFDTESKRAWGPDYHLQSVPDWAKEAIQKHLGGGTGSNNKAEGLSTTTPVSSGGALTPGSRAAEAPTQAGATPVSQSPIAQTLLGPQAAGIPMGQMMGMIGGMMPGGMGGIISSLAPMLMSALGSIDLGGMSQTAQNVPTQDPIAELLGSLSGSAQNSQMLSQAAVQKQAQQETNIQETAAANNPKYTPGIGQQNISMGSDQSGYAYNLPSDTGWPDWLQALGGNHYKEMASIKTNLSWS